jgi:signal transduction histidine kinase
MVGATIALVVLNHSDVHAVDDVQPIEITVGIAWASLGALIASRRPENRIGWVFLAIGLVGGIVGLTRQYYVYGITHGHATGEVWAAWLQNWILLPLFPAGLVVFAFLLFPTGGLPSPRWRAFAWLAVAWTSAAVALVIIDPTPIAVRDDLRKVANPTAINSLPQLTESWVGGVIWLGGIAILVVAVVSIALRLRRARGEERQQLKWFAYSGLLTVGGIVAVIVSYLIRPTLPGGMFDAVVMFGFGLAVPISCGIAILRHGLYEVDMVINKTVIVGVLAAFITAIYVGVVVGIGALIGSRGKPNIILSILATAIIAVAFQPARDRARRFADRLIYGNRATPYEVLSEFAERMGGTFSSDDILPRMARVVGEGTGASSADVWLAVGSVLRRTASWPALQTATLELPSSDGDLPAFEGATLAVPVRHQGELLGALTLSKPPGEPLTPSEEKLVEDLASQAGLVLRNVRLTAELMARLDELQASRQRLVAAQDHERRRIERNIHDGAQQQLVAMVVKLRLANALTDRDPARAREMLGDLEREMAETLDDLRDLARGIYPPLLADKGLVAALEAQARKAPLPVRIEAQDVGRYSQEAEAAVYFCCLEGLQNAAKYAGTTEASVRLSGTHGEITFEVRDEGRGFDPPTTPRGSGLTNMTDRLAALGGSLEVRSGPGRGTSVLGRVPSRALAPVS